MSYSKKNVLNSLRAYDILFWMNSQEGGTYATELAEKINIDRSQASELLRLMEEMGIISQIEGKGRGKYFDINYDGLLNTLKRQWLKEFGLENDIDSDTNLLEVLSKELMDKDLLESVSEDLYGSKIDWKLTNKEFDEYVVLYIKDYLELYEGSSINEMCVEDFWRTIRGGNNIFDSTPDFLVLFSYLVENYKYPKYWRDEIGLQSKILKDYIMNKIDVEDVHLALDEERMCLSRKGKQSYTIFGLIGSPKIENIDITPEFILVCDLCDEVLKRKNSYLVCECENRREKLDGINKEIREMIGFD